MGSCSPEDGGRLMPERIQLSRARGWRKPPGAIVVSRPSMWGNPFNWQDARDEWGCTPGQARAGVVDIYRDWLSMKEPERFSAELRPARVAILANLSSLRGKALCCWCPTWTVCHADVLLERLEARLDALPHADAHGASDLLDALRAQRATARDALLVAMASDLRG